MKVILLVAMGFVAGIIGGMGMGGGTLLVPLLTFANLPQLTIQAINLISFLPMSIVAVILHCKNKLVEWKPMLWITIPALATAVVGAFVVGKVESDVVRKVFGLFLVAVGCYQLIKK